MWVILLFRSFVAALFILAFMGGSSFAEKSTLSKWSGYIVDKSCRASIEGDDNPLSFVRAQTRECALLPSCRKAGYSIFSKGKWFNMDSTGNKLAEKYLQSTKRSKAFYVLVEGSLNGSTINVTRLSEQEEPAVSSTK